MPCGCGAGGENGKVPCCPTWDPNMLDPTQTQQLGTKMRCSDAQGPITALGQHSMVPTFYANWAKVAPRTRTAREAPSKLYPRLTHPKDPKKTRVVQPL